MTVDIKPLVWTWYEDEDDAGVWNASTPFGWIIVHTVAAPAAPASPTWCWITPTDEGFGYQTAADAKAGAETWWEAAVTKCLTQTEEPR